MVSVEVDACLGYQAEKSNKCAIQKMWNYSAFSEVDTPEFFKFRKIAVYFLTIGNVD